MMHRREDTEPWYRQFWPWFIIALPATAVIASLYTVSLALRSQDSLVTAAPDGMDVIAERHRRAEARAAELGLDAALSLDTETGAISVEIESRSEANLPPAIELLFSHPTDVRRDRRVTLSAAPPRDNGALTWVGFVAPVPEGRYYVVLTPPDGAARPWRLNGVWHGDGGTRLVPASGARDEGA
jgi:hypothetical protein